MLKEERQTPAPRRRLVSRSADVSVSPQLIHPRPMDSTMPSEPELKDHQDHHCQAFSQSSCIELWRVLVIIPIHVLAMRQSGLVPSNCSRPYPTKDLRLLPAQANLLLQYASEFNVLGELQ